MKKLLSILGAVSLIASISTTVVSCGENNSKNDLDEALTDLQNLIDIYMQTIDNDMKSDDLKKEAINYIIYLPTKVLNVPRGEEVKWTNLLSKALDAKMAQILMQDENNWKSEDNEVHKKESGKYDLVYTISLGYESLFDNKYVDTLNLEKALNEAKESLSQIKDDNKYHQDAQKLQFSIDQLVK